MNKKKLNKVQHKFFTNNEEYFNFITKDDIKVMKVEFTHNFKIKVYYVIINMERSRSYERNN